MYMNRNIIIWLPYYLLKYLLCCLFSIIFPTSLSRDEEDESLYD